MEQARNYWDGFWHRRLARRRVLTGGAAGIGALTAAACASNNTSGQPAAKSTVGVSRTEVAETPQTGGTFTTSNRDNSPTLDVHRTTSGYAKAPAGAMMSRLLRYKTGADPRVAQEHQVESDLAVSAESPDAITWTVKLRPDAKFHNIAPVSGHAVEAEDIKATITRALDPKNAARSGLDMIDGAQVQTPDKTTVVFKLKYPYAPFKSALASPNYFYIFPREALAGSYDPAKQMIGSGPFVFESYTPDVGFVLKKNPDWFEKGRPYVDSIRWNVLPDVARMRAEFTGGHLDVMGASDGLAIPINDVPTLIKDNPKALVIKSDPAAGSLLFVQLGDPTSAFQDIRLRRAVSLGIDRDTLSKAIYNNEAEPQFNVYLSLGKRALHMSDLSADSAQHYKYNPAEVKKLLQAAAAADRPFKLVYMTGFLGAQYEQTGQTLANMLATSGFKITALAVDYQKDYLGSGGKGIRYGYYDKDWVIYTGISGYDEADEYMFNYFSSRTTNGISKLNDPDFDAMLGKARALLNEDERTKSYLDLQRYVADKMYSIAGLPQPYVYTMVQQRVHNYQRAASYGLGTEAFSKLWIKA